jgi:hypothetical protein
MAGLRVELVATALSYSRIDEADEVTRRPELSA